jgi:DNA-nicking Smr family endonuclease
MEPVRIPIEDVLDLHTYSPKEIPNLLHDYLEECGKTGIQSIRIIHGKGAGILKERVRSVLKKMPLVASFKDAPPEAGGWGATVVFLKQ